MKLVLLFLIVLVKCEASKVKGSNGNIYGSVTKHTGGNERKEEAKVKPDIFDINKGINGLVHGDVIPGKVSRSTILEPTIIWPTTTIPYELSNSSLFGVDLEGVAAIQLGIQEYKLRTCLNFVHRSTESNYIIFEKRSGCYSNVGMIGGEQTISIGDGCQQMSTVCHEMMHAIGIWHEQSRPDRDSYVEIMWDVIEPGTESNFDKYTWDDADDRRVPYDYNSVMHYGGTDFSTNGDPTIVARNPVFQDIIGQRKTFSEGDSTKINRMYGCSDPLLYSYNCNYNEEAECGYVQDFDSDDVDWLRYDVGDKSVTVSPYAPSFDSTVGVDGEGTYMILDTSGRQSGKFAEMRSMRFVTKSQAQCLQFSFYLDRMDSSTASVAVYIGSVDENDNTAVEFGDPIVTLNSDYGNDWLIERTTIHAPENYRLVFVGKTDIYSDDVVAIDDVSVQDKPCEDAYFVVEDYSNVLSTFAIGDYFLSPVMTSTQGYNFQLMVFPTGDSVIAEGWMSMYFGIVQGPNDDILDWPFCNKYIRMMVVDQNEDPLYAMNSYNSFLTSQSNGGDLWNKPSSNAVGFLGIRNFMKVSDLQNTYSYLKNDALMISVLVQDMNYYNGEVCSNSFTRSLDKPVLGESISHDTGYDGYGQGKLYGKKEKKTGKDKITTLEPKNMESTMKTNPNHLETDEPKKETTENTAEESHDHDHEEHEDESSDGMMPVGTAIGIAAATGLAVFLAMSCVSLCVVRSYKRSVPKVSTDIVLHTNKVKPPLCAEEKVTIEPLALPIV